MGGDSPPSTISTGTAAGTAAAVAPSTMFRLVCQQGRVNGLGNSLQMGELRRL